VKLFSFCSGEEAGIGVDLDGQRFNLTEALDIYQKAKGIQQSVSFTFLQVLVELGYCNGAMLRQIFEESWVQSKISRLRLPDDFIYDLPVPRPSKIICLGRNYKDHARELNHELPSEPLFFSKSPSTLIGHEKEIIIPAWLTDRVDHEAELAVIIGKECKNVTESEAMDYLAGYSILNDITARTMQKNDIEKGEPWFRSKSIDTFCPLGPVLVPVDEITDPHDLKITLTVNGKTRQKATTRDMIFPIPRIIAEISRYMTLQPADIIATGTPAGVSPIEPGDVIEISIQDIGTLRNSVQKDS